MKLLYRILRKDMIRRLKANGFGYININNVMTAFDLELHKYNWREWIKKKPKI